MTDLHTAAKLALEALEVSTDWDINATGKQGQSMKAITVLRRALSEEPDYKVLYEKAAQQYNELAELMAEQPAQQEPVAGIFGPNSHPNLAGKVFSLTDRKLEAGDIPLCIYTRPQAREPLTDGLPCCGYTDATAIKWNEFNHAVQCHNCGHTYTQTPNKPLTLDYIDQHIGADEGDREAVVALVREVEAAHGIKEKP